MTQTVAVFIFFLSTTCSAFAAETAWDVLERFGLTGVWSTTCDRPPTPTNFREIYSKDNDGRARREVDFGAGFPIAATFVDSAQIISPSMIKLIVRNADPTLGGKFNNLIIEVVWIKETYSQTNEIRIRGFSSRSSDGKVIVQDGILMSLRKPSFWIYKCRSTMS
jgi:hypothetical protein